MKKKLHFLLSLVVLTLFAGTAKAQEDVTSQYVKNADLAADVTAANNGWTCSWRQDYQKATDGEHVNVVEFYAGWGALENTEFAISQVLTLPAGDYRLAVNAFYRNGEPGDGTNNGKAYIFAGEKKQNVLPLGSLGDYKTGGIGGSADLQRASNAFYKGDYSNAFDFSLEEDGNIEIGFQGNFDLMRSWVILGPVKLYKYTLDAYISDYNAKVEEAKKLYDSPMNAGVLAALKEAATVDVESATKSAEITAAIQALTAAIADAEKSVAIYAATKATLDKCTSILDKDGLAAFDIADILAAYEDGTMEEDQTPAILEAFVVATKAQSSAGADFTGAIVNPSFETGNVDGWTNTGTQSLGAQGNDSFDNKKGNFYAERWHAAGNINFKQTITGLPAGKYKLSAYIYSEPEGTLLIANDGQTTVTANASGLYEVEGTVIGGELVIGVECNLTTSTWLCVDDFKLTLVEPFINVDGVIYATVGENLIKNGSFDNGVEGWKTIGYTTDAVASDFGLSETGGFDGGAYITTNGAGVGSAKTIRQSVEVEADKMYYFTVYTSGKAPDAANFKYNALFKMTDATTEVDPGVIKEFEWPQGAGKTSAEWSKTEYIFTAETPFVGVRMGWNASSNFDGFALYEVEMLSSELDAAKAKANAAIDALTPVGEGLFCYTPESIAAAKAAVEAAETVEEVEAVEMPTPTRPKEEQAYILSLTTSVGTFQLNTDNGIKIEEEGTPIYFVAQENGTYALSPNEGEYINYTGTGDNIWSLGSVPQAYGWTIAAIGDGKYTITGKNNRYLGTNTSDGNGAGSTCYGDKQASNGNYIWTIEEYVEPVYYNIEIAESENGTVTADVVKAKVGETVTLTVTPAEGYELDELTVTYVVDGEEGEETKAVEVTEDYTFTMPEANVTVSATFAEIVVEEPELVYVDLTDEMFHSWDGVDANAKIVSTAPTVDNYENNIGSEVAPGGVVYGTSTVYYTSYAALAKYETMVLTMAATEPAPRLLFGRLTDNGSEYIEINSANSEYVTTSEDGLVWTIDLNKIKENKDGLANLNVIKAPWGGPVTITSIKLGKYPEPVYAIEIAETENGTVTADVEEAEAGATVTLTVTPAEGYELDELTVTYGEDNTAVEVAEAEDGTYTFTMPEDAVTVTATFAEVPPVIAGTTYEGFLAENGFMQANQTDMGNKTEAQTVTVADPVDGVTSITFSGINFVGTTFPMPVNIPEFTIEGVKVTENEDGSVSYSLEEFEVAVPSGMMTINYKGTLQGVKANDDATPVIAIVLSASVKLTAVFAATAEEAEAALAVAVGIDTVKADAVKADGKYLENGKVVIYRNGIKYGVNGAAIK